MQFTFHMSHYFIHSIFFSLHFLYSKKILLDFKDFTIYKQQMVLYFVLSRIERNICVKFSSATDWAKYINYLFLFFWKVTRKEEIKKVLFNYSVLICRVFFYKTQNKHTEFGFSVRQLLMTIAHIVKPNRIADEEARAL